MKLSLSVVCAAVLMMLVSLPSRAAITLYGNRVVLQENERAGSLRIKNSGQEPVMIQSWIDDGQLEVAPEALATPFAVTPPIFRLDAGQDRTLLVRVFDTATVPGDRESLYWLSVLEVPPKRQDAQASLQINVRSRVKLLYRPAGLRGRAAEAPAALRFRWHGQGEARMLRIENPTPWHVNLLDMTVGGVTEQVEVAQGVVAPLSHLDIPLPAGADDRARRVMFRWAGDYGDVHRTTASIEH
ncbi:molecular chaperone [Oceanisphaera sp. KMM 10153]|uniref:fimbrial biogenesis chaperone n=1 Tax=Oceanisphaera submarina TaxID=3390193 RepID=UPI0039764362